VLNQSKAEQPENIKSLSITFNVSQLDNGDKSIKEEQPLNIQLMSITFDVFVNKFLKI
jgi:hypothetical protein